MVSHYHVCTGVQGSLPFTDIPFDNYEDSIELFVTIGNQLFKEYRESDYDLTLEQALEATEYGESQGAYGGPPSLTLYWLRCEDTDHSDVPSWN